MTKPADLETLLRDSAMVYGSIGLFRDKEGWHAAVTHYEVGRVGALHSGRSVTDCDPVTALRVALLEDDRRTRDLSRRYGAAMVGAQPAQIDIEDAIAAAVAPVADEFEGLLG